MAAGFPEEPQTTVHGVILASDAVVEWIRKAVAN